MTGILQALPLAIEAKAFPSLHHNIASCLDQLTRDWLRLDMYLLAKETLDKAGNKGEHLQFSRYNSRLPGESEVK